MFVVAVTLGLLAAMGVYGLSATAYDVRAAGQTRLAAQSQHAGELAVVMTSSILASSNAETVNIAMRAPPGTARTTVKCNTAKPLSSDPALAAKYSNAEACWSFKLDQLKAFAPVPNDFPEATTNATVPFASTSTSEPYGDMKSLPYIRVELTNPVEYEAPSGNMISSNANSRAPIFRQIRATVFSEMRAKDPSDATKVQAADAVSVWRGRIVMGPF